jgi:two-component system CheB/CheR fusion protein
MAKPEHPTRPGSRSSRPPLTTGELQRRNDELRGRNEGLQSRNDQLQGNNDDLQSRNTDLTVLNDDLISLIAGTQMAIVLLDPQLRIRRVSPTAEKILGLTPDDVGRPLALTRLNGILDGVESMAREALELGATCQRETRDRAGRWFSLRAGPARAPDGTIDGIVLVLIDVDSLKRAEQVAKESEARFEMLADSAPVLIWVNGLDGRDFANHAYLEFLGVEEPEVRRDEWQNFLHPDDHDPYMAIYRKAAAERTGYATQVRIRRADGEYRWMKSVGVPRFVLGELQGFVGCSVDITDLKEAEAVLRESDRRKDEFLALVSHELRNPLAALRNASAVLAGAKGGLAPSLQEVASVLHRQTAVMGRMVDDLLDVSSIIHGRVQLRREPLDLARVVRQAAAAAQRGCTERAQSLKVSVPDAPLFVMADPARIEQILGNLLGNAGKFTGSGGHIELTLERELGRPDQTAPVRAAIRVRDDGAGIDARILPIVFDMFAHAGERPTPGHPTGLGLGLTLSRKLVELHGGTIEARSDGPGRGSEFVVRLPVLPQAAMAARAAADDAPARAAKAAGGAAAKGRILVVDDNVDATRIMRIMLELDGHDVRVLNDGAGALAAVQAFRPQVVLLDIGMPGMDGYAVARQLRANGGGGAAPLLIAITGFGREDDARRSLEAGFDRHLTKPVERDALQAVIADWLARQS